MQAHQKLGRSILILIVKVFLIKTIMQKVGPRLIKIFIIFCFKIIYIFIYLHIEKFSYFIDGFLKFYFLPKNQQLLR